MSTIPAHRPQWTYEHEWERRPVVRTDNRVALPPSAGDVDRDTSPIGHIRRGHLCASGQAATLVVSA